MRRFIREFARAFFPYAFGFALVAIVGLIASYTAPAGAVGPQPTPVAVYNTIPTLTTELNNTVTVTTGSTQVAVSSAGRQAVIVQNQSTTTPVCCSTVNTVVCPPTVGVGTGSVVLNAATATNDGKGGSMNMSQFSGALFCAAQSGSANVTVVSFQR